MVKIFDKVSIEITPEDFDCKKSMIEKIDREVDPDENVFIQIQKNHCGGDRS